MESVRIGEGKLSPSEVGPPMPLPASIAVAPVPCDLLERQEQNEA